MKIEKLRLRKKRILGRIKTPEVSKRLVVPDYLPSATIEVVVSASEDFKPGDLLLANNVVPFDEYKRWNAGVLCILTPDDVLCRIVDDRLEAYGEWRLLKDLGEVGAGKVEGSAPRPDYPHVALDETTGTKYVVVNTVGVIAQYKGVSQWLVKESDLLAVLEDA